MERFSAFTGTSTSRRAKTPGWKRSNSRTPPRRYHDWNERITAECYAPNAAARILDGDGHIDKHRQQLFPDQLQLRPDAAGLDEGQDARDP